MLTSCKKTPNILHKYPILNFNHLSNTYHYVLKLTPVHFGVIGLLNTYLMTNPLPVWWTCT